MGGKRLKINSKCHLDLSDEVRLVATENYIAKIGRGYILPKVPADDLYGKVKLGDRFSLSFLIRSFLCRHQLELVHSSKGINSAVGKYFNSYYCHKCSFYECHLEDETNKQMNFNTK